MYEIESCGMFDCACMCESLVIDVSDTNMCSGRVARAVWLKPLPTSWPRTVTVRICARVRISRPRRTCILPCTVTHIHMCLLHCARTPLMMHSFYDGSGVFVMQKKCVHDVVRAIVMETCMCVQCMAVSAHVSLSHVPHEFTVLTSSRCRCSCYVHCQLAGAQAPRAPCACASWSERPQGPSCS